MSGFFRRTSILLALVGSSALAVAAIPTPDRTVTDPKSVGSPANPAAKPVPLGDLSVTRGVQDVAWSADGTALFVSTNLTGRYNLWKVAADGSWPVQLTQAEDGQAELAASPDGGRLLFTQDKGGNEYHDIFAVPAGGGAVRKVTDTPDVDEQNPIFSPDGKLVAFSSRPKAASQVDIAVMDGAGGPVRQLTHEAAPDRNWSVVGWLPDGRTLIANRINILFTEGAVYRVDVASGRATPIGSPAKDVLTFATGVSPDGRQIAISSNERTGQLHAGLLDLADGQARWLKPTPWEQTSGRFSRDGRVMLVTNAVDGRAALGQVEVATLAERPFGFADGVNGAPGSPTPFSPDGRHVLIDHDASDTPYELSIADLAGGTSRQLTHLAMATLSPANLPKSRIVTFRSFDGTLISAVLVMPFNLKRDGSAPAIVLPHGGPTGQQQDYFSRTVVALASRGYVVIAPNFRGSTGYGKAFQAANVKDLGGGDLKDVLAAREFVIATGYANPNKIGITGGSYGGFMTLMALGKAPRAFAAGVQSYGILNWYTMWQTSDPSLREYQRGLIGAPETDKAAYDAASPLSYVGQVKAPLLSLQGENDIRVPAGQAREVEAKLKAQGVPSETIFYPDEGHGFQKREHQTDALERTVAWFDKYLKGAGAK